jgi:hypothetical protein
MNKVKLLVAAYLTVAVLTMVAVVLLRAVWVRGTIGRVRREGRAGRDAGRRDPPGGGR